MPAVSKSHVLAVGAFALCAALAFNAFGNLPSRDSQTAATAHAAYEPATQSAGDGLRLYENAQYRFSLLYPEDLRVLEYDEGGGATTITFENQGDGRGFQIFVMPYDGAEIAPELIARDTQSGAMQGPTATSVAGVNAIAFSSTNAIMGDIREVWFVREGLRYEVVTYQPFDAWLMSILRTWEFI